MYKPLFFFLVLTISLTATAADSFSTLEERMSGREFKETGLGKLTDEELAALNEWVRSHSVATLENATARPAAAGAAYAGAITGAQQDTRGLKIKGKDETEQDKTITSNIVGTFNGWSGETVFSLANGMIWKQSENDNFWIKPVQNPEVTITKSFMGNWRLHVAGHNSAVRVKRIQ